MKKSIYFYIAVCFLITGCQPSPTSNVSSKPAANSVEISQITSTTIPSETPLPPTATLIPPTVTPLPPTTTPTPTIEPPEILAKYLSDIKFSKIFTLDELPTDLYYNSDLAILDSGVFKLKGEDYKGGLNYGTPLHEGEGVVFDFMIVSEKPSSPFEFETFIDNGSWWTDSYRRFGMYITQSPQSDLWMGKVGTGGNLSGNLMIKNNVPYRIAIAVGEKADFLGLIWNPEKTDQFRFFHQPMSKKWFNNQWNFAINGAKGNMNVDNFSFFTFSGFKKK